MEQFRVGSAPQTVHVRIPVWVSADGRVEGDFSLHGDADAWDRYDHYPKRRGWRRVFVTVDLPLPREEEVEGRVET